MALCLRRIESFSPGCLVQEPCAPLGFVDPILQQARSGNVAMLIGKTVGFAHVSSQLLVVVTQLGEHIQRSDKIGVVVRDSLKTSDMSDRTNRRAADFASAFSNIVRGGEDLLRLFVEKKMIVAEMRTRHMPVIVFCFHIKRKYVGE
jgi:hypothetical protein